jgi:competence protein ComEA
MRGSYGGKNILKDPKRVKLLFIVVAAVGIAAVTFADRGAEAGAGDVLYAGQADGSAEDAPGAGQTGAGADTDAGAGGPAVAAGGETEEGQGAASGAEGPAGAVAGAENTGAMSAPETAAIFVDVCGAVRSPAVYELHGGSRVYEAIEAAGGLTDDADVTYMNRATALTDGDRVYVPTAEEVASGEPLPGSAGLVGAASAASSGGQGVADGSAGAGGPSGSSLVNLNTADSAALQTLNGVGPATAQKILDYRDQHGPFAKIEDLKNVSGIGDKTFEKLKDGLCV